MNDLLFTPGPVAVPQPVLDELAKPIIHHRTKAFQAIFADLNRQLQQLFGTTGPVLSIAGSGTTSYEAAQLCLATPGSTVLSIAGGKFGERWQDIYDVYAPHLNLTNIKINHDWGTPAPLDEIKAALDEHDNVSAIAVVHSETSTATATDIQAIAELTRNHPTALLIVDGITSVGAFPCPMDDWGIDCLVTGSQKAMMLPPGLGYVGLGPRALARLDAIDHDLPAYNLDLRKWVKAHAKDDVPFTPPVSLIRAQHVALKLILEGEGQLAGQHQRTQSLAAATRAALQAADLKLISSSPSDSVTGAYYPDGITDAARASIRDAFGAHLAGGQDGRGAKWKGQIFRISHMGDVDPPKTRTALDAILQTFKSPQHDTALAAFDNGFSEPA
ncbi:MAG: alanine--glyoxylate aminotransferase family protein [Planctomycetota bacterium]